MGNQLVGIAPSQIYPVEHYLSDHVDLSFDQSMGSTRFLKVARARSREGLVVVKVFAVHDPSLPLAEHKERILKIKEQLASAFNCLPFQRVILTDKAGLLMREYCKCSVYDRMSTRPFLTALERRWVTFQVLYALHRMHQLGICHGDIKLENIMVTSWLWVLLTDIASFKPTFLPEDNPADFSYFFDTSRRRLCYVAPERIVKTEAGHRPPGDQAGGLLLSESPCKVGELVPSMDIFSAGCALIELWNDGTPALDLPGLLAYRNGSPRPASMAPRDADPLLREILLSMTERDPKDRKSAELYLDMARGSLFPEYFYSFLQSYMLIFSAQPILPPDEKILRIHQDIKNIIKIFTQPSDAKNYQDLVDETTDNKTIDTIDKLNKDGFKVVNVKLTDDVEEEVKTSVKKQTGADSEGLILITSLVTSCIRGLHHCTSKLYSLEILQLLCENSSSEVILDRILPYIIFLTHDSVPRVRAAAIAGVSHAVSLVEELPRSDCSVFPEYILPELAPRATDPHPAPRRALANYIAKLAETAVRFLDQTQNMGGKEATNINYETELSALHEMVRSIVSSLLTDSQAAVKRAVVENGITKLCIFFGKQKANDVILSHMVTFLNDKEEVLLRASFFHSVVGVSAYVGHHAAPVLHPLLQQGLSDPSEWITSLALLAAARLAGLGLLTKQALCQLLTESVPLAHHPNLWIRHEVCGLIATAARLLNPIDVNCKILPLVWPHLKHKLIQVDRPELLLESLSPPIPRRVFDAVLTHRDADRLLSALRERRHARMKVKQGTVPQYSEMGTQLKNLFRRLASDGMTEQVENQLLAMSTHLIKIQRSSTQRTTSGSGRLQLATLHVSKWLQLEPPPPPPHAASRRTHKTSLSHETQMNTEWQTMFGNTSEPANIQAESSVSEAPGEAAGPAPAPPHSSQLGHSASYVQYSMAPCRVELRNLTARMQQKFQKSLRSLDTSMEHDNTLPPPSWRPGDTLLAYLHEHKSSVNRLVTLPAQRNMFASASDDGTVRLWDAARLEGHAYINKSKTMYNRSAGPVIALAPCENGQSLVAASQDGSIFVLRPDSNSSRMTLSQSRQTGGGCVDAACAGGVHAQVITYATLASALVGWDLRAPGNAWKLQGDLKQGVYTCVYANSSGYVAAGTASGRVCVWDLRFQLPVTALSHPNCERVRRIVGFPGVPSGVWACGFRDVAAWCLESTQRTHALWPHHAGPAPLQYTPNASHYTSALYCGTTDEGSFVISGGSDQRARCWRLRRPADSRVLLDARDRAPADTKYRTQIIDGTTVIQEICKKPSTPVNIQEENVYKSVESRTYYHTAPITDFTMAQASKCYLVSSSADGVINVWK
ncbi:phosphoinositide 3-kinase regulatory subunit 4 [Plutella xylostella]|uniref:phosphoinositide 3-kinase regulatory subunit 4 n=1 Tax=Plutella xylostella TaxID=51655 RepID=UPI0020321C8B|nr:phosphoinositide 3-kinase regulatory subunit 4 [Plutella xylostella]